MTTSSELTFKKVKVSDKGQISIPMDVQREIGIRKGDELLLIRKGRRILLEKPQGVFELLEEDFADVRSITDKSLGRIWLRKGEDVWNSYLKVRKK